MHASRHQADRMKPARLAACAALACVTLAGCATPLGNSWADFKSRRAIEQVASDDSFPTAAEVGLGTAEK